MVLHAGVRFHAVLMALISLTALAIAVYTFPAAGQGISLEVEGSSVVSDDQSIAGDLTVGGQITAGSGANTLTNAAGLIDGAKLQPGTVGATQMATGAVTNAGVADGAITAGKIQAGVVGAGHMAANAIDSAKIVDGSVASADLANNAVTSAKIVDGAVATADLANGAVTNAKLAAPAVTTATIADGAVSAAKIANGAVTPSKIASDAITPDKLDDTLTYSMAKLGIGTSAVPYAGLGFSQLALHGPTGHLCPNIMMTTTTDDYPVVALTAGNHDSSSLRFDCYYGYNGAWQQLSSLQDSNAQILKWQDSISLMYSSGNAQGAQFYWSTGLKLNCLDGSIAMPAVYDDAPVSGCRILCINPDGSLGAYGASSIRVKENIRQAASTDTSFIYNLRPVMYDYKDHAQGTNQCGLIAEEVSAVNPEIVSYKHEVIETPPSDPNDTTGVLERTITKTNIPEAVNYEKLIVPMLAEMQRLKSEVDELNARLAAHEGKN